ncbi:MAG TPA: hypothetical protein VIQ05_18335 [Tardiphaga sp.]
MACIADFHLLIGRGVKRSLGIAAATAILLSASMPARAASLIGPGAAPSARQASEAAITQVRGGHGGFHGGGGGGGFHGGGGFRGGAPAFHGGGFRGGGGGAVFHGGGFRAAPAFHDGGFYRGGGIRHAAPFIARRHVYAPASYGYRRHHFRPRYYGYAPVYYGPRYYHPRRFCRIVWTYYGPRKICRYRPWLRHHWRHHHRRFNVYR